MGSLYLMTTIVDRKDAKKYSDLFLENNLHVMFLSLGYGTATNEILDYFGLESREKAVVFSVLEEDAWTTVKKQMEKKLKKHIPIHLHGNNTLRSRLYLF